MWEWQAPLGLICELGWATVLKVSTLPTGLGGGSASGKTTVARMIIEALDVPWVVLLSMDSFYKVRVPCGAGCLWEARGPRPGLGPESAAAPSAQPPSCQGARSSLQTRRARNGLLTLLVCAVPADGSPPSRRVKRAHFPGGKWP